MFSGIITAIGKITQVEKSAGELRLTIDVGKLSLKDLKVGDSIAVNGVCLTIICLKGKTFQADVSQETLACTVGLDRIDEVNLEKALRVNERLNGHLVLGHVDDVGVVHSISMEGERYTLRVKYPAHLAGYIARKGSITLNGVSLTVNQVNPTYFSVNLIPHTRAVTTLKNLKKSDKLNLEIDMMASYIEKLLNASSYSKRA